MYVLRFVQDVHELFFVVLSVTLIPLVLFIPVLFSSTLYKNGMLRQNC